LNPLWEITKNPNFRLSKKCLY